MMRRFALIFTLITSQSFAMSWRDNAPCFPLSDKRYPADAKNVTGLTEFETNQIVERFKNSLEPVVRKQLGKKLILNVSWEEDRVNAKATRDGENNPVIILFGGMARHPEMTTNGLAAILCHELGHHLGGAPKKFRGRSKKRSWSSAEGQADYFAGTKCLPLFFGESVESLNLAAHVQDKEVQKIDEKCGTDQVCSRIALAGLSVSRVFASLKGYYQMPSFELEDQTEVWQTNYGHPTPQCRLDTIVSAARCNVSPHRELDNIDPTVGTCYREENSVNEVLGARPLCWYKPEAQFK